MRTAQFVFGLFLSVILGSAGTAWARGAAEPAAWSPAAAGPKEALPASREVKPASLGRLLGTVTDVAGVPFDDSLISATGPSGTTLTVCDTKGRFEFTDLRPGRYLLRAHVHGFTSAARHVVMVRSGLATDHLVTLRRADASSEPVPAVLAAGFVPVRGAAIGSSTRKAEPLQGDNPNLIEVGAEDTVEYSISPHDDSEKAWWLRRARRSVLKDAEVDLVAIEALALEQPAVPRVGSGYVSTIQSAPTGLSSGFPLSGQFHLLTRTSIHSSHDLRASNILPGQIAYVSLGGTERQHAWDVRGAVRTGDAGSWVLSGTYVTETSPTRELAVGLSYSRQDLKIGTAPDLELLRDLDGSSESARREAGSLRADGQWRFNPKVTLDYGVNLAGYGYLEQPYLFSPNAAVTLTPIEGTRVRVAMSQYMLAPGAEEFLPPSEGVWLPPERTFAPLSSADPLQAERSRHFEVSVEHDLGRASTVGVRRFAQDVEDQIVTLFGIRPFPSVSLPDRYYAASASGVATDGWAVMFAHTVGERFTGSVDYSRIDAKWAPLVPSARVLHSYMASVLRSDGERLHDITTSLEAEIPESATRVLLLYRINSAFAKLNNETMAIDQGFGSRFSLRVRQVLPFSPIEGSRWEVLVDVRSLFREQVAWASVYDELLVISPPKEVVGGLVVNF